MSEVVEREVYLNRAKFHIAATSVGYGHYNVGYRRIETDDLTDVLVRFVNMVLRDFGEYYVKADSKEQAEIDARLIFLRKMMGTFSQDSIEIVLKNLKHPDKSWIQGWAKEIEAKASLD